MDFSDTQRIRRLLRQIRAKISSLNQNFSSSASESGCLDNLNKFRPKTYKQRRVLAPTSSQNIRPAPLNISVKRNIESIHDFFADTLDKVILETDDSIGRIPSLLDLSCFALVKTFPVIIDDCDLKTEELCYNYIPEHCRQSVLLQHVIELFMQGIKSHYIIKDQIQICYAKKLYHQSFELLKHLYSISPPRTNSEHIYLYSMSKNINKQQSWIRFLTLQIESKSKYAMITGFYYFIINLPTHDDAFVVLLCSLINLWLANKEALSDSQIHTCIQKLCQSNKRTAHKAFIHNNILVSLVSHLHKTSSNDAFYYNIPSGILVSLLLHALNNKVDTTLYTWLVDELMDFTSEAYTFFLKTYVLMDFNMEAVFFSVKDDSVLVNEAIDKLLSVLEWNVFKVNIFRKRIVECFFDAISEMKLSDYLRYSDEKYKYLVSLLNIGKVEGSTNNGRPGGRGWKFDNLLSTWTRYKTSSKRKFEELEQLSCTLSSSSSDEENDKCNKLITNAKPLFVVKKCIPLPVTKDEDDGFI